MEAALLRKNPFAEREEHELLGPSLRSGAKQLGNLVCVQSVRGTTRASLVPPLRFDTKLAFACSGTSSHSAVLGVELEQPLQRRSCIQISQRIGSAANPGGRADGNRELRGSRALTAISVGRQTR